jgi:hypothetical protein
MGTLHNVGIDVQRRRDPRHDRLIARWAKKKNESPDLNHVFDVNEVREVLTKHDTGTTFLLTQSGLYEIRSPVVERQNQLREQDRMSQYDGGG